MVSVLDLYRQAAARQPRAIAVEYGEGGPGAVARTWSQLLELGHEQARALAPAGVGSGSLVAVECSASVHCVAAFLAAWETGAAVLPLDPQWGPWLRERVLTHSGATALVATGDGHPVVRPLAPSDPARFDGPRVAVVSYTSGTTGDPKGVVLPHAALLHAYRAGAAELARLTGRLPRVIACAMRPSGLGVISHHWFWGALLGARVVMSRELDVGNARDYWARMADAGAEFTYLVPPLVAVLNKLAHPPAAGRLMPVCGTGGAPLSPAMHARFQERFGVRLLNFYGQTEVGFTAFFGAVEPAGAGRPEVGRPGISVARLRGEDGEIALEAEAEGELELSGPSLADGYHRNPEAWARTVQSGWLATGDVARRDRDGGYRIVGRRMHAVNRGGVLVYLSEIESAASELDDVLDVGAVRLQLADEMEDVGLIARLRGGARPDDARRVQAAVAERLGRARAPRRVMLVDEPLPRVSQGKLDRARLLDLWHALADAPAAS